MRRVLVAVALVTLSTGCGDFPTVVGEGDVRSDTSAPREASAGPSSRAPEPSIAPPAATGPTTGVLYDEEFVVEDGVWYLGDRYPGISGMFRGQVNGLVGAGARGGVWVMGPALYGKFRVRITSHQRRPRVPA